MRFKKIKQKYKDWFGCGPISIICGTLLVVISLEIEEKLEISKINISEQTIKSKIQISPRAKKN